MLLARALLVVAVALPAVAWAQRETTREALDRLEEVITMRVEDGRLSLDDMVPSIVVSVAPAFEESRAWYPNAALSTLTRILDASGLRLCEACMTTRTYVSEGRLEQLSGALTVDEIIRLDDGVRGPAQPARTAIWLDENADGVSLRIVDLGNSRLLLADNIDPELSEMTRTQGVFTQARELDRRARRDSITQTFFDFTLYPRQHVSLDWTEQWGDSNRNLSGLSLSIYDPVLGIGGAYYRALPDAMNIVVGGKVLMSMPTALVQGISGEDVEVLDRLLTAVFMVRIPIASSNYGVTFSASTNGNVGVGVSLMNISLLPVLP